MLYYTPSLCRVRSYHCQNCSHLPAIGQQKSQTTDEGLSIADLRRNRNRNRETQPFLRMEGWAHESHSGPMSHLRRLPCRCAGLYRLRSSDIVQPSALLWQPASLEKSRQRKYNSVLVSRTWYSPLHWPSALRTKMTARPSSSLPKSANARPAGQHSLTPVRLSDVAKPVEDLKEVKDRQEVKTTSQKAQARYRHSACKARSGCYSSHTRNQAGSARGPDC